MIDPAIYKDARGIFYRETLFGRLCSALAVTTIQADVNTLYQSLHYYGNEVSGPSVPLSLRRSIVVEVLTARTNADIIAIKTTYKNTFNEDLERRIVPIFGDYQFAHMIQSILTASRDEEQTSTYSVEDDVETLYESAEARFGSDPAIFFSVLSTRPFQHLNKVFALYTATHKKDLLEVAHSEFSSNIKTLIINTIKTIENRPKFIAEQLEGTMWGIGTRNWKLIRLIVRNRFELKEIKQEFLARYRYSLYERIRGDTQYWYRKMLLATVGRD